MEAAPNEALAAGTGQDSTVKEPVEAHKSSHGAYKCPVTFTRSPPPQMQAGTTVNPLGSIGGRK